MKKKIILISFIIMFLLVIIICFDQISGQFLYWEQNGINLYKPPHVAVVDNDNVLEYAKLSLGQIYKYDEIHTQEYTVRYRPILRIWEVNGVLPNGLLGGVPTIFIRANGKIVAYWHTK